MPDGTFSSDEDEEEDDEDEEEDEEGEDNGLFLTSVPFSIIFCFYLVTSVSDALFISPNR